MKMFDKVAFIFPSFSSRQTWESRKMDPRTTFEDDVRRKFAFTLAEVLITLGIIGVVSVLTIPNIISNYQKKVYVTQLQKGYAQLQQLFDMAMADDEVEYLADTELMNSINGEYIGPNVDQSAFISQLGKYMKIQKACNPMDFSDGCHDIYYLDLKENVSSSNAENDSEGSQTNSDSGSNDNSSDEEEDFGGFTDLFSLRTPKKVSRVAKTRVTRAGTNRGGDLQIFTKDGMIYYFNDFRKVSLVGVDDETCEAYKADGATACRFHTGYSGIRIDVNGKKGPNKQGRDLFGFMVDERGHVHPFGSSTIEGKKYAWDGEIADNGNSYSCTSESYGVACAGRIMDQGWVMDY